MGISCFTLCDGNFSQRIKSVNSENVNVNGKYNDFFFFRESHTGNGWARLRDSRLESVYSRKGERRTIGTSLDHLCARRN